MLLVPIRNAENNVGVLEFGMVFSLLIESQCKNYVTNMLE